MGFSDLPHHAVTSQYERIVKGTYGGGGRGDSRVTGHNNAGGPINLSLLYTDREREGGAASRCDLQILLFIIVSCHRVLYSTSFLGFMELS